MSEALFVFCANNKLPQSLPSLVLNKGSEEVLAFEDRPLANLTDLQQGRDVVIVLPSKLVRPFIINLPSLKKSSLTIPNLLEDYFISSTSEIHFALNEQPLKEKTYLVSAVDKKWLQNLINQLNTFGIKPNRIHGDFFIGAKPLICLGPNDALLSNSQNPGAVSQETFPAYLHQNTDEGEIACFSDSANTLVEKCPSHLLNKHQECYGVFIAKRLLKGGANLLQGEFQAKQKHRLPLTQFSMVSASFAIALFIAGFALDFGLTKKHLNNLKSQSFALYKLFFPNATTMISPRFRIESYLRNQRGREDLFLQLLRTFSNAKQQNSTVKVQEMTYQNKQLLLTLSADDFKSLNQLRKDLNQSHFTLKQLGAETKNGAVLARWSFS
jgi:type II secretory pathway component PulL